MARDGQYDEGCGMFQDLAGSDSASGKIWLCTTGLVRSEVSQRCAEDEPRRGQWTVNQAQ